MYTTWRPASKQASNLHAEYRKEEDTEVLEAAHILMRMRRDFCGTGTEGADKHGDRDNHTHKNRYRYTYKATPGTDSPSFPLSSPFPGSSQDYDSDQSTVAGTPEPDPEVYFHTPLSRPLTYSPSRVPSPTGFLVDLSDVSSYAEALPQSIATRNHLMNLQAATSSPLSSIHPHSNQYPAE